MAPQTGKPNVVNKSNTPQRRMIVLELNGAERHFLEKYVAEGKLPTFQKLLNEGKFLKTTNATLNLPPEKGGSYITPWMVWPTVYTGMPSTEHGIVGFGQDPKVLQGRFVWDKLNALGITTGIFGSLMSAPVRNNPQTLFYLPGMFSNTRDAFPKSFSIVQEFFAYATLSNAKRAPMRGLLLLLKLGMSYFKGIPASVARSLFSLIPAEFFKRENYRINRFLLQAELQMQVFLALYQQYQPEFATLHLNHINYAQHLYWRATEPEFFKDTLGELDHYYFRSVEERKYHELPFNEAIFESFRLTDEFLEKLLANLDQDTLLVIMTGFGQKKRDPVDEIHKPEVQLKNIDSLLQFVDIHNCEILSQMNPDITLNFNDVAEASLADFKLSNLKVLGEYPLFLVKQIEHQLFLQETLPQEVWFLAREAWIENISTEVIAPLFDYVQLSPLKDQHSAHDVGTGWMLLYGNKDGLIVNNNGESSHAEDEPESLEITEICPLLLSYFDDNLSTRKSKGDPHGNH